jgi:hypothetical protein
MLIEKTFFANIYVGAKEGYDGKEHSLEEALNICQSYCDKIGYAFTVTETNFVYKYGREKGFIIGLIQYPRFPKKEREIIEHAIQIASIFLVKFKQNRISIVTNKKTYMIGDN